MKDFLDSLPQANQYFFVCDACQKIFLSKEKHPWSKEHVKMVVERDKPFLFPEENN